MEKKNLNLVPADVGAIGPSAPDKNLLPANVDEGHMKNGQNATMDVTGSLRKISRELAELAAGHMSDPDAPDIVEGASWLIHYIADCLDVELQHAVARGRKMASEMNGNVQIKEQHSKNTEGQRIYEIMSGDDI